MPNCASAASAISRCSALSPAAKLSLQATSTFVVELDPAAQVGLFRLKGLQRRLTEILGSRVDLLPEPVENPRLRQKIDRDRRLAF
jgi:hypothetical protein